MSGKEEFLQIYRSQIHREGAEALLEYLLQRSDFFTAPASARYHSAYAGGLCDHSLHVYDCLKDYLEREDLLRPGDAPGRLEIYTTGSVEEYTLRARQVGLDPVTAVIAYPAMEL